MKEDTNERNGENNERNRKRGKNTKRIGEGGGDVSGSRESGKLRSKFKKWRSLSDKEGKKGEVISRRWERGSQGAIKSMPSKEKDILMKRNWGAE